MVIIFIVVGGQQRIAEKCEKFLTCWVCICMNFHSVWTKRHKIAADNFWTRYEWDLNLSQLVVSDIFFRLPFQFDKFFLLLSTSISIWRVFSSSIFNSMLDGTSFGTVSSRFACLFVCLDAGPTSKLATNFRFRPSIIWSFQK